MRIAAYALMVVSGLYCITATLEIFLVCRPLAYFWNPLIRGGSCIDIMKSWFAVGLTNVLIDVLILALPLPVLWSLKMSTRRKFELSAIFSLGIFIIIISALRIKTLLEFDPMNLSGSTGAIGLWSDLEPLLGILNCCLPVLQPIVAKFTRQKVWSKAGSKYSKRSNRGASSGRRSTRRTTTGKQSTQKSDYTRFPTDIFPPAPAYTVDYAQWSQDRSVSTTESYDFDIEAWKQRSSGIVVREEWDVSRSNSG